MKNRKEKQTSRLPKGWGGHSFEVVIIAASMRKIKFESKKKYHNFIHF